MGEWPIRRRGSAAQETTSQVPEGIQLSLYQSLEATTITEQGPWIARACYAGQGAQFDTCSSNC